MDKSLILIMLSQLMTAIATVAVIKTDITWIKKKLDDCDKDIRELQKASCNKAT